MRRRAARFDRFQPKLDFRCRNFNSSIAIHAVRPLLHRILACPEEGFDLQILLARLEEALAPPAVLVDRPAVRAGMKLTAKTAKQIKKASGRLLEGNWFHAPGFRAWCAVFGDVLFP